VAGIPKSALVRIALLIAIVGLGIVIVYHSPASKWMDEALIRSVALEIRSLWWTPVVLILAYLVFGISGVPSAPLFVAGAVFGPLLGTIYNVAGLLLAAIVSFFMAQTLGREFVLHVAKGRFYRVKRFLTRFGFWPLVQARFMPIPDSVLNFSAALSGVPFKTFVLASIIGLLPSTLIHTWSISLLIFSDSSAERAVIGAVYLGSFIFVNVLIGGPWIVSQWRRRRRYKDLCEMRAQRSAHKIKSAKPIQ